MIMKIFSIEKIIFTFAIFFLFSFSGVDGATLSKPANNLGLQLYYSFDEGTSTQATDFSGNRRNGTLQNMSHPATASSGWGNGKVGKALIFDGTNDNVSFSGLTLGTTNTISVWIKPQTGADYQGIISDASGFNGLFYRNTTGLVSYYYSSVDHHNNTAIQKNVWTHFVVVNNAGSVTFYVNGISDGTSVAAPGYTPVNVGTAEPTVDEDFTGSIDEVRVYSRALTETEVRNLYNTGLKQINSSTAQKNVVTSGLIGYWTLDGGLMTASTAYDSSVSANTLSLLNGPQKTVGKTGQSINLDATDDELFCTDANCGGTTGGKMDMGTRDWTVMAWVKPENGGTNCNIRGTVVGKIGDDEIGWYLGIGGQFICAEIRGASNISSTLDGSTVPLNEWSHVAVVFDRDGNMTRYLNGVQTGTQDNISANNGSSVDHPHNFCIGARDGAGGCLERMYDGSVDEVRVYERVLTASEIKQVYNAGVGAKVSNQNVVSGSTLQSGLVGLWSFNGVDLTDRVYDRSGQGNDGYFVNISTSTAKVSGKVGQALNFDGTNDFVNAFSGTSLDDLSALTYAAWIKPRSAGNGRGTIVAKSDTASVIGLTYIYFDNVTATNGISFLRDTTGVTDIGYTSANNAAPLGEWTHVAVSWDGTVGNANNVRIYINGVESTYQITDAGSGSLESDASNNFTIGARTNTGGERYFDGFMDEVRVYNRVLTASEVKQLYNIGR